MTANLFDLPDSLVARTVQATAWGQNTQTADELSSMARPVVPEPNGTLDAAQIALVMTAIDTHFDAAKTYATQWEVGNAGLATAAVKDVVQTSLMGFERYAQHIDKEYGGLIDAAYRKDNAAVAGTLRRFKSIVEVLIAENKGAKTAVADYEAGLAAALAAFEGDFQNVLMQIGSVSQTIHELRGKISSLQSNIAENNAAVLDTFLDTGGKELVQGVTMAGAAAKEDGPGVVKAGVQMGVTAVQGAIKIVRLNQKSIDDLVAIRKLSTKVSQDEVVLVTLLNIGTMLCSLGATQGLQLQIVGSILDYWSSVDEAIADLLQNHEGDLAARIDTTNYSPTTIEQKNPAFPPWNVIFPSDRTARVFKTVRELVPTIFDDDTKFEALE